MLDFLRRGVKTWVAKVLFGLLVVSFAIWGIGDVFGNSIGSSVATVGDQKITAERYSTALNAEIRNQSRRFGQPIDGQMARAIGLDRQVLARMAQEATLDQAMAELNVSAPDDAVADLILSDPSFSAAGGAFDEANYRYVLAQSNFTVEQFEEATRRALARSELANALSVGAVPPVGAVDAIYDYQTERRSIEYIAVDGAEADIGAPSEDDLIAFHAANEAVFMAPETRDAVYIALELDALGATHEPDDAALRTLYDQRSALYDQPERRALYQIVFDDEAAAVAAKARLDAGEVDFDGLLAERGETRADTSFGEVAATELSGAVGDAAFASDAPGVVGPADTGFGFALIDVAAITPAEIIPFEDARGELAADLRREAALDIAPEVAGEIDDLRASGSSLEEIAKEMNLPLLSVAGISRDGGDAEGIAREAEFLTELFEAEEGEERDILETANGDWFVLRVDGVAESALRPLDEVRTLVEAGWRQQAIRDAATSEAAALAERLAAGETLAAIAASREATIETEGPKTRLEGWAAVSAETVEEIFAADEGAALSGPSPSQASVAIVARLAAIESGEDNETNRTLRESLEAQMSSMAGEDALSLFLAAKQEEAGVTINQQLIEAILTGQGGGHGGN